MGNTCCQHSDESESYDKSDIVSVASERALSGKEQTPSPPSDEKPKPQVFAIMRNGHEVLRGSLRDCDEYLQKGDVMKFAQEFRSAMKWQGIHAKMEDGSAPYSGFFPILNGKFDNICKEMGLMGAHDELEKLENAVLQAIMYGQIDAIRAAYASFSTFNEQHYKDEEAVMMPKVKAMMESKENLKKMMAEQILPIAINDDFQFFVEFAMRTLEKHHEGQPRARVFAHALSAVATTDQWRLWELWIQKCVSPALFMEIKGLACPQEGPATPAPTVQARSFGAAPYTSMAPYTAAPYTTMAAPYAYAAPYTTTAAPISAATYGAPFASYSYGAPLAAYGSMATTMPMTTMAAPATAFGSPYTSYTIPSRTP